MDSFDQKNTGVIDSLTMWRIKHTRVLVVGAGGLGGHLANLLVRLGIKTIHLCDYDVFQPSNINRQLFSSETNIGQLKVEVIKENVKAIRSDVQVVAHACRIEDLEETIWHNVDVVVDAVDSFKVRRYLEDIASKHNLPLLHGAVAGWYGQVGIVMPGSDLLTRLFGNQDHGLETELGCPTFIPAIIAGMMVSELVKFLQDDGSALVNKILMIDVRNHDYRILDFNQSSKKDG